MRPTYRVIYEKDGVREIVDKEFTIQRDACHKVVELRRKGFKTARYEQLRYGKAPR